MDKNKAIQLFGTNLTAVCTHDPEIIICEQVDFDEKGNCINMLLLYNKKTKKHTFTKRDGLYFNAYGKKFNTYADFSIKADAQLLGLI